MNAWQVPKYAHWGPWFYHCDRLNLGPGGFGHLSSRRAAQVYVWPFLGRYKGFCRWTSLFRETKETKAGSWDEPER